jgi:hypothetical protein
MNIHYQPNPLRTVVELDDNDLETLRLKLIIEDLQDRIYGAHFHLVSGERFDVQAAIRSLNVEGLEDEPFEKRISGLLAICVDELRGAHIGDCTCQPCTCMKCYAETLLGIDTIKGLDKHAAIKIENAFASAHSFDEALTWLDEYKPVRTETWLRFPQEDFDRHVPRWTEEARQAADWLRHYRRLLNAA